MSPRRTPPVLRPDAGSLAQRRLKRAGDDHAQYVRVPLLDLDEGAVVPAATDAAALVRAIGERFDSYFEVRRFADGTGTPYSRDVDFMP
jgi:hypothetical protein